MFIHLDIQLGLSTPIRKKVFISLPSHLKLLNPNSSFPPHGSLPARNIYIQWQ